MKDQVPWMQGDNLSMQDATHLLIAKQIDNQNALFNITSTATLAVEEQTMEKIKDRERYRYPAILEAAQVHKNAAKFGYNARDPSKPRVLCPCCDLNINTEPIPFCYETTFIPNRVLQDDSEDFLFPSSVALFFTFIKMIIIYLLFRTIITDAFNFVSSLMAGDFCTMYPSKCTTNFFTTASGLNKVTRQDLINVLDILNLAATCLSIVFFLIYRRFQYKIYDIVDAEAQTQDDYTLFIENIPVLDLPPDAFTKKDIELYYRKHLEQIILDKLQPWVQNLQSFENQEATSIERQLYNIYSGSTQIIRSVNLCFNVSQLETLNSMKEDLMSRYEFDPSQDQKLSEPQKIINQIKFLNTSEIALCKRFATDNSVMFSITHFVGKAFVSFQYQHYREYIMREMDKDRDFLLFNGQRLRITKAANPKDIFWANMSLKDNDRKWRIITSFTIMLLTLIFVFGVFFSLDVLRRQTPKEIEAQLKREGKKIEQPKGQGQVWQFFVNYSSAIFITLFTLLVNDILWRATVALTEYQKHKSRTVHLMSLIVKLLITQWLNTAVMMFIITLIYKVELLSSIGLVVQMTSMVVVGGTTGLLTNAIGLPFIQRRLCLLWYFWRKNKHDIDHKFQIRVNKQWEYLHFDIAGKYVYYIMQVYLASFYSYITPVVIPVLALIFVVQYWIDKCTLLSLSSLTYNLEFYLSRQVAKMFQLSIVFFTAGNLVFSLMAEGRSFPIINVIALGISILFVAIVMFSNEDVERRLFGAYETFQIFTYESCVRDGKFQDTYWKENPATYLVQERDVTGHYNINNPIKTDLYQYGKRGQNNQVAAIIDRALSREQIYDKIFHKVFCCCK